MKVNEDTDLAPVSPETLRAAAADGQTGLLPKRIFLDRQAVKLAEGRQPDAYYFGTYRTFDAERERDSLLKFAFANEVMLVPADENLDELLRERQRLVEQCNLEWAMRREAEQFIERLRQSYYNIFIVKSTRDSEYPVMDDINHGAKTKFEELLTFAPKSVTGETGDSVSTNNSQASKPTLNFRIQEGLEPLPESSVEQNQDQS